MGTHLMKGGVSNPNGHFEDIDIVNTHDDILKSLATSWQFSGEVPLITSTDQKESFIKYIQQRDAASDLWGFKDPRTALFLAEWSEQLGSRCRHVITFRHWGSCIQSLYNRESRELSHRTPTIEQSQERLNFFTQPDLAATMWLEYNKKIIHFIKKNSDRGLLISATELINSYPLIETLNERFNLNLTVPDHSVVNKGFFTEEVDLLATDSIGDSLREQLNQTWEELCVLSDTNNCPSPSLVDNIRKKTGNITNLITHNYALAEHINKEQQTSRSTSEEHTNLAKASHLSLDELTEKIKNEFSKQHPLTSQLRPLIDAASELMPYSPNTSLWLGKLAMLEGEYERAELYFHRAIYLGDQHPYMQLLLGNSREHAGDIGMAEKHYKTAYEGNNNNIAFTNALGRISLKLDNLEQALYWLQKSRELMPDNAVTSILLSNTYEALSDSERAHESLSNCDTPACKSRRIDLTLATDTNLGKEQYAALIRERLSGTNLKDWLHSTIEKFDSPAESSLFINWIIHHWLDVFEEKHLVKMLGLE